MQMTQIKLSIAILGLGLFALLLPLGCSGSKSSSPKDGSISQAEKIWGNERACLPCHLQQQPIARRHNYRCDTCHMGNPWAETIEEAHDGLLKNPQDPANISLSCNSCHQRVLGKDVPYNADFIRDIVVSHKRSSGENLEWSK